MSVQSRVPQELSRVLYRSFLRASRNGRYPEVFGRYGAVAYNAQCHINDDHPSLALPDKPIHVRQRLKSWFQDPPPETSVFSRGEIEPLEALRVVREQERLISYDLEDPPSELPILPIFDCDNVASLPGETTQLLFLEPRYQHLASVVLNSASKNFLLRPSEYSKHASLLTVLSHVELDNGSVVVTCLGGGRVTILEQQEAPESVEGDHPVDELATDAALTIATSYNWMSDSDQPSRRDGSGAPNEWMETRQYILDLLNCVLPNQDSSLPETLEFFGLPPLDPEGFSFWALRFILSTDDSSSRLKWSFECRSVSDRLDYIVGEVESILDSQEDEDGASVASSM